LRTLFGSAILEPLKMLACLVGAALISWRLLLLAMLLAPVAVLAIRWLATRIRRECSGALQDDLMLNAVLLESYGGIRTVQAYSMESQQRERFRRVCHQRLGKAVRIRFWSALAKPAAELIGIAAIGIAILAGAYLVLNQETELLGLKICDRPLSLPSLLVFYGMLIGMSDPARKMSDVFGSLQVAVAAAIRVFGVLDQPARITDPVEPVALPDRHRRLVLDGVTFQYAAKHRVLRDVSFQVDFGETLAIVGPNGCGKSTLANLISRFYDPNQGSVRLDDIDLKDVRLSELRARVGLVTQQTFLFNDTVLANIRHGLPSANDEQVVQAAHQAGAHEFIESALEHGYDTVVGPNGNRLSGGQRQRLALARALLKDPEILILDEATSQIDPHSERLIQRAIEQSSGRRTTIIITHRSSTLHLADRVLVLDAGQVAACGTHDQLLADCHLYRRLFGHANFKQPA
jgi:ATP-binding cassette subfamily B protein/subfamily B ATP-binding cassette protein MsbA